MAQGLIRYRCFLPDLTEFAVPPCTGPNYQQSTSRSFAYTGLELRGEWRRGRDSNPRYGVNRTHDFQSCTFNRSVTSPQHSFNYLALPPVSKACRCPQNVSTRQYLRASASFRSNVSQGFITGKEQFLFLIRYGEHFLVVWQKRSGHRQTTAELVVFTTATAALGAALSSRFGAACQMVIVPRVSPVAINQPQVVKSAAVNDIDLSQAVIVDARLLKTFKAWPDEILQ